MQFNPSDYSENGSSYNISNATPVQEKKHQEEKRLEIDLPFKDHKAKFDTLGVEWPEQIKGTPFTASAKLPAGWRISENHASDFDKKDFAIIDDKGLPRATIWMKVSFYDPYASVRILSSSESEELSKQYSATEELNRQFQKLVTEYQATLRVTDGCGHRGQLYIDQSWQKISDFVLKHPEYESKAPRKKTAVDDGTDGVYYGMLASGNQINDRSCTQQ